MYKFSLHYYRVYTLFMIWLLILWQHCLLNMWRESKIIQKTYANEINVQKLTLSCFCQQIIFTVNPFAPEVLYYKELVINFSILLQFVLSPRPL